MSGMAMMMKSLGLDLDEIQKQGKIAGEIVTEFRDRMERMEHKLDLVLRATSTPTEKPTHEQENENRGTEGRNGSGVQ